MSKPWTALERIRAFLFISSLTSAFALLFNDLEIAIAVPIFSFAIVVIIGLIHKYNKCEYE